MKVNDIDDAKLQILLTSIATQITNWIEHPINIDIDISLINIDIRLTVSPSSGELPNIFSSHSGDISRQIV